MAISSSQEKAYANSIETAGIDSASAKSELYAKMASIGSGHTVTDFETALADAKKGAKIGIVLEERFIPAIQDPTGSPIPLENLNLDIFEKNIIMPLGGLEVPLDIRPTVKERALQQLADRHVQRIMSSTGNVESYLQTFQTTGTATGAYREDLANIIRTRAQDEVNKRVQLVQSQLTSGAITEQDLLNMINPTTGTIRNPQVISAIRKQILETPERKEAEKKTIEENLINTDATTFKNEVDQTATNNAEVDFDGLTQRITLLPEFASLPGPIRALAESHMKIKKKEVENARETADLKDDLNKSNIREKQVERNQKKAKLFFRNIQWVAMGAVVGGGLALLISGNPTFSIGVASIGTVLGGLGGIGLSIPFDKNLALLKKEVDEANILIRTEKDKKTDLDKQRNQIETAGIAKYARITALVESLARNYDREKAVTTFLKTAGLGTLEEIQKI